MPMNNGDGSRSASRPATVQSHEPPSARRTEVVDLYHGMKVVDPYRWMETATPEFDRWLETQNAYARRVLSRLPGREGLLDDLRRASRNIERVYVLKVVGPRPRIFTLRRGAEDETFKLTVRDGWDGQDRLLVDPNTRPGTAINSAYPSQDGRYVAYPVSDPGNEDSTIEVIEVDSGRILADRIGRAHHVPLISWRPDGRSFFYWRRAKSGPNAQPADWYRGSAAYLHKLGDNPDTALPVIAAGDSKLGLGSHDTPWIRLSRPSNWAIAESTPGSDDPSYFVAPLTRVRPGATRWRRVASPDDKVTYMRMRGDRVFAFTYSDAPNYRIVSFDAKSETVKNGKDFVPESNRVLVDFAVARDAMYLVVLDRSLHRLFRVSWETAAQEEVELPFDGSIEGLVAEPDRPGIIFGMEGWTRHPGWFRFEPGSDVRELEIDSTTADDQDLLTERSIATSRDGTEIPVAIIRRKSLALDRTAPGLLSGYGAYGSPIIAAYQPFTLAWVRHGAVFAYCHVRGGGEGGHLWHVAGIKEKKENGVDDFIACAEHLVRKGYTAPTRLTAFGSSAGGIVVGGAITKRPDLFRAAWLDVPIVNLLRNETTEVGPANTKEFGSTTVETEFRHLLASDPYHRIRDNVSYPALLFTVGRHDVRVPVWQAAKFVARLQAIGRARPTLFRVDFNAGHGFGSRRAQREEEYADAYSFALWQAGVKMKPRHRAEKNE